MRIRHNTVALDSADRIRHRATVRRKRREAVKMAEAIEERARQRRWTRADVVGLLIEWELPSGFLKTITICPEDDKILVSVCGLRGPTPIAVIHICDDCLNKDDWPTLIAGVKSGLEAEAGIGANEFTFRSTAPSTN